MVNRGSDEAQRHRIDRTISEEQNPTDGDRRRLLAIEIIHEISSAVSVFRRGESLYQEGDDDGYSFIVDSGWIELQFSVEDGKHCIVDFCLPGDILCGSQRNDAATPLSAICVTSVAVRRVRRDTLLAFAATSDDLRNFLCRCAECQAYRAYDHLANVTSRDARSRVAHLMFELYCRTVHRPPRRAGAEIPMPLRLAHVSAAVGLTPVHVSRTFGVLRDNTIIDVRPGKMTVLDPGKWRRLTGDFVLPRADPVVPPPPRRRSVELVEPSTVR